MEEDDQAGLATFLERRVEEMVRTANARAEPPEGHPRMLPLIRLRVGKASNSVPAWPHVGLLAEGGEGVLRGLACLRTSGSRAYAPAAQQLALASRAYSGSGNTHIAGPFPG